jgi:transcriptional regulator with XRE-family HTH domain
MKQFGKKLQILREQRNMSQRELGEQLDLSRSYISNLESGRTIPNARHVLKIANLFSVTTDVLMQDELELDEG